GTLWATSRRLLGFESEQLAVLESLAQQLGSLLERIALEKEEETRERMIRELEGISKTQSGEQLGILPADSGFDAVGRCRSVCEVGGDLCELIPLGEGRTLVAVGDACGHSVQAAFVMTAVRSAMRAVIDDAEANKLDPTVLVAKINRALCRVTAGHQFMSCLVGIIDRKRMVFDYANAGHPVPILYRQGQGISLESHGLPLGILTDAAYSASEVALRGDDLLVLFSDGLLETMNEAEELFRSEGVIDALTATATADPLDDVLEQIWGSCEQHGVGEAQDDRTLLVVRMQQTQGPRPPHHVISSRQPQLSSR
ncbi:MAG: PP2C family protein-serine/threonine phosphatase, partial [Planctomycetaceae bacterium]